MTQTAHEQFHAEIAHLIAEALPSAGAELISITYALRGRLVSAAMVARGLDVPLFAYAPVGIATPHAIASALVLEYWATVDRAVHIAVWGSADGFDAEQAGEILRGGARLDA